jgi:dihydroxy-acid dehydratase
MLDGWWQGRLAGSGTIVWEARKLHAEGKLGYDQFMLVAEHDAAQGEHLRQVAQGQLVAQTPEHYEMTSLGYRARFRSVPERSLNCLAQARQRNLR